MEDFDREPVENTEAAKVAPQEGGLVFHDSLKPRNRGHRVMGYGAYVINGIFVLAGLLLVPLSIVASNSTIVALCPDCMKVSIGAAVLGSLLLAFGVLGCVTAQRRSAKLLMLYIITLALLVLAMVGMTVAVIVVDSNGLDLHREWDDEVQARSNTICDIQ
eukprot:Sspe_Gene.16934::Locus_5986_Transcript_1_1_Confidence_1.000_Length_554::g.16934::m.16934